MKINKESIVKTRPWRIFGEGPIANADIKINAQGFNDGQYTKAGSEEIRFTQSKDGNVVYDTALAWPKDQCIKVRALSEGNALCPQNIKKIELLGYGKVKYERTADVLTVSLPAPINNIMPVIKVTLK